DPFCILAGNVSANPPSSHLSNEKRQVKGVKKRWVCGKVEVNVVPRGPGDKFGATVSGEIVLALSIVITPAAHAEGCSQIAHFIKQAAWVIAVSHDRIVLVFQVHIAQQSHHDA